MDRNSPSGPFAFLLASAALFLATFLSREKTIVRTHAFPAELTTLQIGMMAFAMAFLVYAAIGFASIWLDGQAPLPHRRAPSPGRGALVLGLVLCALLAALAGLFVRIVAHGIVHGSTVSPAVQGLVAGGMSVTAVAVLLLYQRKFMTHEVMTEDEDTEVPW